MLKQYGYRSRVVNHSWFGPGLIVGFVIFLITCTLLGYFDSCATTMGCPQGTVETTGYMNGNYVHLCTAR